MKIIHTADLHLYSKIDKLPLDKGKIRREEILRTFEKLCEYAKNNGVSVVIISGDMFDTNKVTQKILTRVFTAIENTRGTDFLYLSGNHDEEGVFDEIVNFPSNFKIFNDSWSSFSYENVVISGIAINLNNSKIFYDTLKLESENVNVVCLHGQIAEYNSTSNAELISLPRLKNKNIDYLALGHIHSYSLNQLDDRGVYCYSGCLEGRGFDETGEKGFSLLNIENNNKITSEFIPFSFRNLYSLEYDITGRDNWFSVVEEIVKDTQQYSSSSLLKVIISGEHGLNVDVDKDSLALRLNEQFFFAKVYDESTVKVSLLEYENDKSVRGEFVREVLNSNLSQQQKDAMLMIGLNALKGEDI